MPSNLRIIAVHVEEPEPGDFAWVLTERSGSRWDEIDHAANPVKTYRQAMADGLLALQALVPDLDAGPRNWQSASDKTPDDADEEPEAPAEAPRRGPLFGFGPAR